MLPIEVFEAVLKNPAALIELLRSERELSRLDRLALALHFEQKLNLRGAKPKYLRVAGAIDRYRHLAEALIEFSDSSPKISKEDAAARATEEALQSGDISEQHAFEFGENILVHLRRPERRKANYDPREETEEEWLQRSFREYKELHKASKS